MKKVVFSIVMMAVMGVVLSFVPVASAVTIDIAPSYAGTSSYATTSDYICEKDAYEFWLKFDLSSIPSTAVLSSASLRTELRNSPSGTVERTLWYDAGDNFTEDALVGTVMSSNTAFTLETFGINTAALNWAGDLSDNTMTLMVTGPQDGSHVCGWLNTGGVAAQGTTFLSLDLDGQPVVPEPTSMILMGIGLAGAALRRRRK